MSVKFIKTTGMLTCLALSTSSCILYVDANEHQSSSSKYTESKKIFGPIHIRNNQRTGNISNINGSIKLGDKVQAEALSTVNGNIKIGNNTRIDSANTVNGNIHGAKNLTAEGSLTTVNGGVRLQIGSDIHGRVKTVNGNISLSGVTVGGNLNTVNGNIVLKNNSQVKGDIIMGSPEKSKGYTSLPKLEITQGSKISGEIILYREVDLQIYDPDIKQRIKYAF